MKQLTLIYGEAGTGKTTLALQCSASASRDKRVTLYIDCDNSFSLDRLAQITSQDFSSICPYIFVFRPQSFDEQHRLIENIERYITKNVALIVVDTITSLYRLGLQSSQLVFSSNRMLNRQLAYLYQTAMIYKVTFLLTSQVHDVIGGKDSIVEPVATRVMRFWSHNILKIKADRKASLRRITLEKHLNSTKTDVSCNILINETGVVDLD